MKKIKIEPRYIVDNSGKKKEVILNIKTFEKTLEQLEEMCLIKEAKKALQEDEFVDFKEANKKTLSKVKVIFMHGNGGCSPEDYWFPYLKNELEKLNITVIARQFPDSVLARDYYWLPFLKDELQADENTILIGHSSGAVAAMRFAETNKLLGTILVAAMHTDLGMETETISGYYNKPWLWQNIQKNQSWIAQFASIDDPYIPIEEARFVQKHLKSEYTEFTDQGHFGSDTKKTTFPEIVQIIKQKLAL